MAHGNGKLSGIEVKASSTVTAQDFRGLRKLQASEPDRFHCGVLVYDGEACLRFGEGMFAVPVSRLMV